MPEQPHLSRRAFLSANAILLGGFGLASGAGGGNAVPAGGEADEGSLGAAAVDLAQYRPVSTSSTAYGPWPGQFAVDRLAGTGVRGTGWRAGGGDPQWITVDLQAPCRVEWVVLVFEATTSDPAWIPAPGSDPYADTTGWEIMSSCATAFQLDVSTDNTTWTTVYQTSSGTGGVLRIPLPEPVTARWVRMTATKQANSTPLQLNGFQVYGTSSSPRPPATGWSDWGRQSPPSPPELSVDSDGTLPVESGWALTLDDWADPGNGAVLSTPAVRTAGWVSAAVPGTVLASLVEQGHFPDPVAGFGNLLIPEALSRHSWWYRRSFRIPLGFATGPGQRIWLEFDGINHQAQIWLNGALVGELTHPAARGAFDVTSILSRPDALANIFSSTDQVLAVRISPMPHPGSPGDKGPSGVSFLYSGRVSLDFPSYISVSGWDWMPAVRDRVSGIWDHVRLRSTGPVVLGDPRVDTSIPGLPDTSRADVTIAVPVRNASSSAESVTVTAAFGDVQVSTTISVPGHGQAEAVFSPARFPALRLRHPRLWWPNGYGEPALHDLVMTASAGGSVSDRRTRRFGLRQVDYVKAGANGPGSNLQIKVNGVPVFCRGGNWGWDELLRRMLPDRIGQVMSLHRDMNFTMIRNWGGCSSREEFYSAADENGILVWSEFWEGDGLYPPTQNYDAFLTQARDTILRYRIHPCIVVWCGANEVYPPPEIDAGLSQAVQQVDPAVLYHSNSAAGGTTSGGPYDWVDPSLYYSGVYESGSFGFHTEIGLPTVPVTESMQDLAGDQPSWPIGGVWYLHDWCTQGNQHVLSYQAAIEDRLGPAASLDDFCRKAQFVNYENVRAMFEAWNARLWNDATGLMLWMSNPAHHSTVWQTYDYDLDVNGTYYGARKGCEPVHVQASLTDWQVLVANHTTQALTGATVTAELYDLSGQALGPPQNQLIAVAPSATATAFTVPFTASLPSPHMLRLRLVSPSNQLLSENVYWRYRSAEDLQALNQLPQVQVSAAVRAAGSDGQDKLAVTLRNNGDAVAAMVVLSLRDRRSRQRVLPTLYSDNYLWLLPGETREVTLSWSAAQHITPQVLVNGYNLPRQVPG